MKPASSDYKFKIHPQEVQPVNTENRTIKTSIPHPEDIKTFEKIMKYESSLIQKQLPIVWDHAKDFSIFDRWGNKWIDLSSTIFVTNSGHANPMTVSKVSTTLDKGLIHSYCYPTVERANFLEKLIQFTPSYLEQACLVSTGTEASERAIKLARIHGMGFSPRKKVIVGGIGNYHGKTMGAMMSAMTPKAREWIGNQDPDMHQMPFPYPWLMEEMNISGTDLFRMHIKELSDTGVRVNEIAAFIIEGYQGWGAIFYPKDYIKEMKKWAEENDALVIVDEIQSGFGRTGKLFAYQHYDIEPDLVVCGKGISGSLPLSAVLGRGVLIELDPTLTSTHGGHPISCAASLGNLEFFEKMDLVNKSNILGQKLYQWLIEWKNQYPHRIHSILGNGMVWAVFISKEGSNSLDANYTDQLVERAMQKGVYSIRTGCGTLKLGPPLTIPQDVLKESIEVYKECMYEMEK